jgi:Zn-dependent M28 family amino/carboxypeptidase
MAGRDTPSDELDSAAAVLARRFADLGLTSPPGVTGFIERYIIPGTDTGTIPDLMRAPALVRAPNVLALLPGRDDELRDEVVVVVAHFDHLGIRIPVDGDSIYNGADDNASGTAAVLELAQAFRALPQPPRRSILFLLVSGEEHGLWGSAAFVQDPVVPLERIVAAVNFDMVGRNSPDSVFIGDHDRSSLGALAFALSDAHPEVGMRLVPGPGGASDHLPFRYAGIPAILFFAGLHTDYHTPDDEADRLDYHKTARVVRMGFYTIQSVANSEARPTWIGPPKAPAGP